MKRTHRILKARQEPKRHRRRRGPRRQHDRREAERIARLSALLFARWVHRQGLSVPAAAHQLGMDPSTLRSWQGRWSADRLEPHPRGRPIDAVDRDELWSFLGAFGIIGPQVGLPTLQELFPGIARAALIDLQSRCRVMYRDHVDCVIDTCRWTRAGSVWALDFTDLPAVIERIYTHLILLRDLASGKTLLAILTAGQSDQAALNVLETAFRWFGVPLAVKADNGGPFSSERIKALLRQHGVLPLYSPPGTPRYNGSVEAGIGSIKQRAFWRAAYADRPGDWTCDDVEGAVIDANRDGRPRGSRGPSPDEAWNARTPLTEAERQAVHASYDRAWHEEYARRGLPPMTRLQHQEQAAIDRVAIRHALMEHGFLLIRRRRITPPVSRLRTRKIS